MKNILHRFLYVGLAAGEYGVSNLHIRRMSEEAEERFRFPGGQIQIYYVLFPEYAGRSFWRKKPLVWKRAAAQKVLSELCAEAEKLGCEECIWNPRLPEKMQIGEMNVPAELLMAELYRRRPFTGISISLERNPMMQGDSQEHQEAGQQMQWDSQQMKEAGQQMKGASQQMQRMAQEKQVLSAGEILAPYLPKMKQVVWVGRDCREADLLEEYLYEEYGLLLTRSMKSAHGTLWLDLEKKEKNIFYMPFSDIQYVNRLQTLKFLDTAVKNGYNTEVN